MRLRLIGVLAIALMLRPSIAGVGPIIDDIQDGLALPGAAISLLTALPVLCFGFGAVLGAPAARRLGIDRTLALAVGLLAAALLLRVVDGPALLFTGTLVSGLAIAVMNVLLPRLVKQDFAERAGLVTGLYTAALGSAASIAALIAVPLKSWTGDSWRGSLGVWGLVAIIVLIVWLPQVQRRSTAPVAASAGPGPPARALLTNRRALALAAFMGLQSLSFYVCLAWLPSLLKDAGDSETAAGAYLSLLTALGIPMALIVPTLAARRADQRVYAVGFSVHDLGRLSRTAAGPGHRHLRVGGSARYRHRLDLPVDPA